MASREKRPLAPSKSKQKVNNDCTLSTIDQKNRKGNKSQTITRQQQQIGQDILEAVATGSELPVKINASLPRKNAIKNLRRKPKLKTTKSNLIKVKITKKAPIRALRKPTAETIRAVKGRRTKRNIQEGKTVDTDIENPDNDNDINKSGSKGSPSYTLKNSLKSKKLKYPIRTTDVDNTITEITVNETDTNNSTVITARNSAKTGRKLKITYKKAQNLDNQDTEDNKTVCRTGAAKKSIKEKEDIAAGSSKNLRLKRNAIKEGDVTEVKSVKSIPDCRNLVDLTIDEVVGAATEELQVSGKKTRKGGRKVSERILSESEIKKELITEGKESDAETSEVNQIPKHMNQNNSDSLKSSTPRKKYNRSSAQRSLRNGKLRRSSEFGIQSDLEMSKQFKLDPEDNTGSDTCTADSPSDINERELYFFESDLESTQGNMNSAKGENQAGANEKPLLKNFEDNDNNGIEIGNNNNGERGERTSEVGPILRSKTKAKTADTTATNDAKNEEIKLVVKSPEVQDDSKQTSEQTRKENILVNILDKPKSRRSSLNVEMKKAVGSFYGSDKPDNSKSQIDQMIENIKLNIVKSIESKIFGPEKSLVLNKNFETIKTEEIVAPLSAELQKKNVNDKDEDLNKPNISKNETKSENSDNNEMPKLADTAKKIEKMVMGEMEIIDTQSQNSSDNGNVAKPSNLVKVIENADDTYEKDDAKTGNSSSDKSDQGQKCVKICLDVIDEDRSNTSEKKSINTRQSGMSTERSSTSISKSVDCDKSLSLPEIGVDIEREKRLSIVLNKTDTGDRTYIQNTRNSSSNGNDPASGNKNMTNCNLNYETFKQELKGGQSVETTRSVGGENQSPASPDNERMQVEYENAETENCLDITIQSEESESLESISKEVERLVGEGKPENTEVYKSMKQSSDAVNENLENCLTSVDSDTGENEKLSSENCKKNLAYDDFNDIVATEAETTRFFEALESSFTDSEILNMTPEINEVLAQKELSRSGSLFSKESLDLEKSSQESGEDAERSRTDKNNCRNQATAYNHPSTLKCEEMSSRENVEISSELPSQGKSDFSNVKETEQKSNGIKLAAINQDESNENIDTNIENNRSSDVSSKISSFEKQTNSQDKATPRVSVDTEISNVEDTMKKDSQIERIDKRISAEEQTTLNEEHKRVLRARDRQRKVDSGRKSLETVNNAEIIEKNKSSVDGSEDCNKTDIEKHLDSQGDGTCQESTDEMERTEVVKQETDDRGPLIRTRRSREVKKRKDEQQHVQSVQKPKRSKRDNKKSEQQNKEETLLDNEVAKINENTQSLTEKYQKSYKPGETFRGFSEGGSKNIFNSAKVRQNDTDRSHSETDLDMVKMEMENVELSKKRSDNIIMLQDIVENPSRNSETASENDKKIEDTLKTPETLQKDIDESSTSSESSSSAAATPKILETPEDKVKKESILRLLGLESLEKAAERMSHQKAKKEQYTGTLKTVIRVQKEKDKKRSRSPLKMVLKQGRSDGDGDSPEFYTIQKELGTSGLGDSSSGANRKFSTNHRHSCDEDPEEPPSKDRQSLVIPEKSSSFSIHPGRLCADVCCYCYGKFGSLDTPMHLAQMKSDERRKKILNVERHLTKDSCLCDACYRHVDRKANTSPTNMQSKPPRQHRQLMVSKCSAKECREPARHHVKRRWLLKIKAGLHNQVDIDWESSQHTSMSFCVNHYSKIERFLTCALCKRRLARNHAHQLVTPETDELNDRLSQQGIPVPLSAGTFVCKLCRYFTQLQLKYKVIENMNANHKSFFKSYRKRILHYHDIEVLENEEEDSSSQSQPAKDKEKRKKSKCSQGKSGSSKSLDSANNSTSEKSTPEPNKNEGINFDADNDSFANQNTTMSEKSPNQDQVNTCRDVQLPNVQETMETLKKRKSNDTHAYNSSSTFSSGSGTSDLVEILAMDKEVTLTRIPKKAKTSSDITPVVQRLGANPSISVRTLFPGEEEMNLHGNIEFNNVREVTPQGWEKCATIIQYDRDTKLLWQELQRPYGNQSSFLRHLILLEKYYRSGDLVLAPNASRNAINYSTSVQNRLISYEGPEKVDEPILEPISSEFASPRRLSGGFVMERDRLSMPSTSSFTTNTTISSNSQNSMSNSSKISPPRILKLNSGVSIIKKPPPNLHRLNLPSTSTSSNVTNSKRKDNRVSVMSGGKVFQLSEPEYKKLQNLKRQKQMLNDKQMPNLNLAPNSEGSGSGSVSPSQLHNRSPATQYQKAQIAAQTQFQKHLRMQQEMLSRQSRSDFEPLICDVRPLNNDNNPAKNLLSNLNLPKSIQVTTKSPNTIPAMPKIPKSLTVIPQTITRPADNK